MALPETIPVRYTEEEAGYVSVRPVVRQTFRLNELLDMILRVTGKDVGRIRQILRSGTVTYHFYRYWWEGFDAGEAELNAALAAVPDPDPSRAFSPDACATIIFESGGPHPRVLLELDRAAASQRRWFRNQSFWERLLQIADQKPEYHTYSYAHRADLYRLELNGQNLAPIAQAAIRLAPRSLRPALRVLPHAARVVFVCPRPSAT